MNNLLNSNLMDQFETEVVNMDDVQNDMKANPNAITMNTEEDMNVASIPDIEKLTEDILNFLKFTTTYETKLLIKENYGAFQHKVDELYPDIPYSITKLLMDDTETAEDKSKNLVKLLEMLSQLSDIKKGNQDINKSFNSFRECLHEEYVYPKFGGKDEFERKLAENNPNQQTTENNTNQQTTRKDKRKIERKNKKLNKA
jgi:hypothetical protein